jgi:hypothetical protein
MSLTQEITRDAGMTWISLTGGQPSSALVQGIDLPEPVPVNAGEWVTLGIEWLSGADREDTSRPFRVPRAATVRSVHIMPSAIRRGHLQAAIAEGACADTTVLPDHFMSAFGTW